MGKISLPKNKFKILFMSTLFILIIFLYRGLGESQEIKNLPESHGCYILKGEGWLAIPEMKTTLQTLSKGTESNWGILGIDSKPGLVTEDQSPVVLILGQALDVKNFILSRLWHFEKLRAQDFCGTPLDPISFKKSFGVEKDGLQPFGKWTPVGIYNIKGGPLPNRADVIRIFPQEKLPSGVYAICQSREFTSLPVQINPNISVWAFEISGAEPLPFEPVIVENPRVKVINCCISDKLEGIESIKVIKDNFSVSENQIIAYLELQGQRPGEIIEFIWFRPDGTIQERQRHVLSFSRGVYQSFNPNNLLMPGKWMVAIKIYGELVKCIPLQVSAFQ